MFEIGRTLSSSLQAHRASLHTTLRTLLASTDPRESHKRLNRQLAPARARKAVPRPTIHLAAAANASLAASEIILETPVEESSSASNGARRNIQLSVTASLLALGVICLAMPRHVFAVIPDAGATALALGVGIDQVALSGQRFAFANDIFDALDLPNAQFFATFDAESAKARIERLPWIDKAEIKRVYPNRLDIRVTERKPFALWSKESRNYLIDEDGHVLAAVSGDVLPNLPRVAGTGAPEGAKAILDLIAGIPQLSGRVQIAERAGGRRWVLKLAHGAELSLPSDGEAQALRLLVADPALLRAAEQANSILEFRANGLVTQREVNTVAPTTNPLPGAGS